ncbi:MAG: DUF3147 family protein [Deltaproteobacteria bacterium]|nr:MAG: DUF3147 family protein [Deltaproteobacteria bacterium]
MIAIKFLVTALVVVAASELARVSGRLGAFVAALPLVSLLVIGWMRVDGQSAERVADYALYTFWYVLPTLPMFLLIPWLVQRGHGVGVAVGAGLVLTVVLFAVTALVARRFGVMLLG